MSWSSPTILMSWTPSCDQEARELVVDVHADDELRGDRIVGQERRDVARELRLRAAHAGADRLEQALALHRHRAAAAGRAGVEERRRRLAANDEIRDRVGVALVGVAGGADAALQRDAAALLDHVRGLVRGGVEIGRGAERDAIADRVRLRADRGRGVGGLRAGVGLDGAHVVARSERALDLIEERQRGAEAGHAARRGLVDLGVGGLCAIAIAAELHGGHVATRARRICAVVLAWTALRVPSCEVNVTRPGATRGRSSA